MKNYLALLTKRGGKVKSEEGRVKNPMEVKREERGARVSATTELSQTRPAGHGSLFPLPLNSSFFTLHSSLFTLHLNSSLFTKKASSYPRMELEA